MVAVDLWGPAPINSDYGMNYYISFVDSFSRYTWILLLKSKSDTKDAVIHFIRQAENLTNQKLKTIQTDGGSEFKTLKEFFSEKGINHRITCPHTSEQNGIVERKHRHIVDTGLTLLAHASMPLKFLPDAFTTAVFLINRMPTKVLGNKTPLELLYNTKPDYSFLKTFGCLCYPYTRPYNQHKLSFRSLPCTFLGYATNQKGYKCLTSEGKIIISRHVAFNECIFPFTSKDTKNYPENL
jgi:hypothetical protein